jgi:hypothetical protein
MVIDQGLWRVYDFGQISIKEFGDDIDIFALAILIRRNYEVFD